MTDLGKEAGDAVETLTAPLKEDLTNDPIDMVDIIGGGMAATVIAPIAAKLPFDKIANMSPYIPNADTLEGFTELGACLVIGSMTKGGKGTTGKLTRKAGNIAQVGAGTLGASKIVSGVSKTITKIRGGKTETAGTDNQQGNIWAAQWSMY